MESRLNRVLMNPSNCHETKSLTECGNVVQEVSKTIIQIGIACPVSYDSTLASYLSDPAPLQPIPILFSSQFASRMGKLDVMYYDQQPESKKYRVNLRQVGDE